MSEAAKKKKKQKMKKFVRKRKTFASAEAQTAVGEVYILDAVRGGSADRGGGGLVRELPSKLIQRLRGDLNFAARVQKGNAKINGKLKEEMAVITRDAYVSRGKARLRLGQALAEKAARGRESIQFFKHQLALQKTASLRAAQLRTEGDNLALQTQVKRRNHEIDTQNVALQAMGALSDFDEAQLHEKDHVIEGLKTVIGTLASQLEEERQRSEYMRGQRNDTQGELFHAYSALGRLAMANGHASDVHMMYDVDQPVYEEQGGVSKEDGSGGRGRGAGGSVARSDGDGGESRQDRASASPATTSPSKSVPRPSPTARPSPASGPNPAPGRVPPSMRHEPLPRTGVESHKLGNKHKTTKRRGTPSPPSLLQQVLLESSPSSSTTTLSTSRRARPQSAGAGSTGHRTIMPLRPEGGGGGGADDPPRRQHPHSAPRPVSAGQRRRMRAARSHRQHGRISHEWRSPNSKRGSSHHYASGTRNAGLAKAPVLTPLSQQTAAVFAKKPFEDDPSPFAMVRSPADSGDPTLRIRAGATDCYSPAQLASFLQSTTALPQELRPPGYFPPPATLKNWETLLNEEDDRLTGKAKELRQHRYVRWRPVPTDGHDVPPTIRPSPLRAMAKDARAKIRDRQMAEAAAEARRNSVDRLSLHVRNARARKLVRAGPGSTAEREDGVEEGPNIDRCATDADAMVGVVTLPSRVPGGKEHERMRVATNLKEDAALRSLEGEVHDISALYPIERRHRDFPNVNKLGLFEFDEEYGTYRYKSDKMPSAVVVELRRKEKEDGEREAEEEKKREEQRKWEQMAAMDQEEAGEAAAGEGKNKDGRALSGEKTKKRLLAKKKKEQLRLQREKRNMSTTRPMGKARARIEAEACRSVSADPRADRALKARRRPKSAALTRRSEKKMLDRLRGSTGSRFFGPGMGVRKNVKSMRTSGSARYLQEKIRQKLAAAERANFHDDDDGGGRDGNKRKKKKKKKKKKERPMSAAPACSTVQ
jgi:hypothetical protein